MSWLTGLASRAEEMLNKVDQSAAVAFNTGEDDMPVKPAFGKNRETYTSTPTSHHSVSRTESPGFNSSKSVPAKLSKLGDVPNKHLNQTSHPVYSPAPANVKAATKSKKDKDEELFEFLNSSDSGDSVNTKGSAVKLSVTNGKHSRHSSTSSTASSRGRKTPDTSAIIGGGTTETLSSGDTNLEKSASTTDETDSLDQVSSEVQDSSTGNTGFSSGYHSNHEDESSAQQQQLSALELENKLLKNEIASLNHEMASVIQRAKASQEELSKTKKQSSGYAQQLSKSDQIIRELQARENDFHEALGAKDSQLGVLRVRFEENDKILEERKQELVKLRGERDRILQDHTSASGVQSQALDSLKDRLVEAEAALRRQQEEYRAAQEETSQQLMKHESEQLSLTDSLKDAQRKLAEEKARVSDYNAQVKSSKQQAEAARNQLNEYKEKASRILQSKDRLISSLKEGGASGDGDASLSQAELEQIRQERDMYKEELQQARMNTDSLRAELQDIEVQMQTDSENSHEHIRSLEEQLDMQKRQREDAEQEVSKQKQELRFAHEELLRQKTTFQNRLQESEADQEKLRQQLSTKSMSSAGEVELENRLHALTESLIEKQTMLEALSTEKNSLGLQLERLEQQYKDVQSSVVRASVTAVTISDTDEAQLPSSQRRHVRQRQPGFTVLPHDNNVTRRVKRAANEIDRFSMRIGLFLRRYPIARVFIILYMVLLHLWVMVVLLTYQPEMHGSDFHPLPPEQQQPPGHGQPN